MLHQPPNAVSDTSTECAALAQVHGCDEQLKEAVIDFLDDCSIEATPHGLSELDRYPQLLSPGTTVYVAHPPNATIDEVIGLAERLETMGYRAVPHLAVRRVESQAQLGDSLARLQSAGIDRALLIAGDSRQPAGPYDNTMQVLETGLLPLHGINTVGIAGHPEGSRVVGPTMLRRALLDKAQFAADTGMQMYVVTQFGFNPSAVTAWERATASDGVTLPIHVGMVGMAPLRQLMRYAVRCGVSASARLLLGRASALSKHARLAAVDELVVEFARYRLSNPDSRMVRTHFYAFGGVERTARWLKSVRSGRFDIVSHHRIVTA